MATCPEAGPDRLQALEDQAARLLSEDDVRHRAARKAGRFLFIDNPELIVRLEILHEAATIDPTRIQGNPDKSALSKGCDRWENQAAKRVPDSVGTFPWCDWSDIEGRLPDNIREAISALNDQAAEVKRWLALDWYQRPCDEAIHGFVLVYDYGHARLKCIDPLSGLLPGPTHFVAMSLRSLAESCRRIAFGGSSDDPTHRSAMAFFKRHARELSLAFQLPICPPSNPAKTLAETLDSVREDLLMRATWAIEAAAKLAPEQTPAEKKGARSRTARTAPTTITKQTLLTRHNRRAIADRLEVDPKTVGKLATFCDGMRWPKTFENLRQAKEARRANSLRNLKRGRAK